MRDRPLLHFALSLSVLGVLAGTCGAIDARAGSDAALASLQRARTHAAADEHDEAIVDYRRAFQEDPTLAERWAHELGHQLTWADRPGDAVPWYERRLRAEPSHLEARLGLARALSWDDRTARAQTLYEEILEDHPDHLEALRGRARMIAWQDRLEEARLAYEEILADHPDDHETLLQRAQVVNWSGRHAEAAELYRAVLTRHPESRQATMGLAQALRWSGKERQALRTLDPIREQDPVADLYRELRRSAAPVARVATGWSEDSDELRIRTTEASWEGYTPRDVRGRFVLRHLRLDEDDQPDLAAWGVSVGGSRALDERTTANLHVGFLRFGSDGPIAASGATEDLEWTLFTYDGWLTWQPSSRLRVDLASDRGFVETPRSLGHRTAVTHVGLSADLRVGEAWTVGALMREGFYSDGNGRTSGRISLDRRLGRGWVLSGGPRLTAFRFHSRLDRGYWNPGDFVSAAVALRLTDERPGRRVHPRLELTPAREWEDGESYGVLAWSLGLRIDVGRNWQIDLAGGRSDSRLSTDGGYERGWARAVVGWRH